ncbi:MAG: amidase [Porticoccaceae bacterium]|nr:amidase [Porticoccaceae bacterium]
MTNKPSDRQLLSRRAFVGNTIAGLGGMTVAGRALAAGLSTSNSEVNSMTALQLSSAIKAKQVSCKEVMSQYLSQIARHNDIFNAAVELADTDFLLAEAARADADLRLGLYRGWMHGFPHLAKDLVDATGFTTTYGSRIFMDNIASQDAIPIARIKKAGAIIIGKSNISEFGLGSHSYNAVYGTTYNAYDGVSTAGGSSGGAATALALQMIPVADGSDMMGSLRNPAGYSNVIGFRPTPGRVPTLRSFIEQLPCNGPMGRNVSDTAMLLSTMAGYDPQMPTSLNADPAQFTMPLQADMKGKKIAWLGDLDGYLAFEKGVIPLCEIALQSFRDVGCSVDEVRIDYSMEELWQTWLVLRHWINFGRIGELYNDPEKRKLLKPEVIWEVEGGRALSAADVYAASEARADFYQALLAVFKSHDFLVLPTAQVFPFDAKIPWPKEISGRTMDTYHRWMEVVVLGTLSGCPVITVPAGFSDNRLPMGLQIIGPRYEDFATLQMAYAYEQASRWNLDFRPKALSAAI